MPVVGVPGQWTPSTRRQSCSTCGERRQPIAKLRIGCAVRTCNRRGCSRTWPGVPISASAAKQAWKPVEVRSSEGLGLTGAEFQCV